ncbi:MAG: helix-turn-helix domain-containing protein [Paraglaciecola sp.]|uniref:helix-turn-helix domain-containing protein n=1 Tax=Paraglaciecola sp. TaxID=1920173 RepID=UPI003263880E
MEIPLSTLFLINALICGLLASHLIINPVRAEHTVFLGSCYALFAFLHLLGFVFLITDIWQVGALRAAAAALVGPLFYYYFQKVLRLNNACSLRLQIQRAVVHSAPAIFVALVLFCKFTLLTRWVDLLLLVSFWTYLGLTINCLVKSKAQLQGAKVKSMMLQWLMLLIAILGLNAVVEILIVWEVSTGKRLAESVVMTLFAVVFLVINVFTIYCALQRHPLWDWMLETHTNTQLDQKNSTQGSAATQALVQLFIEQLNRFEWFKAESGFTVAMAASELEVSQRQLSEAINAETGKSYSQLMNQRRVEEAVDMIRQNPEKPLTAVIYDSGFRTKSSFNREFVKITGKTPSEFQQTLKFQN